MEVRPDWKEKVGVVMTSGNNDPEDWKEIIGTKHHKEELARKFKDNNDPMKIAIVVDKGADSADCRIANLTEKGDVIVTQDYGLAALILGKGGKALNQNGLIYTNDNIDNLLFTRHISKKECMAGNRTKGPKKRTHQNDTDFLKALLLCLE